MAVNDGRSVKTYGETWSFLAEFLLASYEGVMQWYQQMHINFNILSKFGGRKCELWHSKCMKGWVSLKSKIVDYGIMSSSEHM